VRLTAAQGQIDAAEDLFAFDGDVQIRNLQCVGHFSSHLALGGHTGGNAVDFLVNP
jgi:hypothetical protein